MEVRYLKSSMICLLLIIGLLAGNASAGEERQVELDDGSVIYGKIVALEGDVFTIESKTLGMVKIKASRIRNIRMRPDSGDAGNQFQELRQSMMNDPKILEMIFSLQDDPEVQEILKDPSIMKSLKSGNIEALMSNPKVMKLLNNPKIQDIKKKVLK